MTGKEKRLDPEGSGRWTGEAGDFTRKFYVRALFPPPAQWAAWQQMQQHILAV
ncbi:MAG: hypothetical protein NUW01_19055 [Gemmatimonadaceae bacterium]|nr:hypothetical protein [Gemmatimonadaceae bacterium]